MTIQELEEFLSSNKIPETVNLNKAVRINDTAVFINTNMMRLKAYKGDIANHPSYWHLCELVEVLKEAKDDEFIPLEA